MVIVNIYLFLIPAFVYVLLQTIDPHKALFLPRKTMHHVKDTVIEAATQVQLVFVLIVCLIALYLIYTLYQYWQGDVHYALGNNLNQVSQFQQAYYELHAAAALRNEPVFLDTLAYNDAIIATALLLQKDTTTAAILRNEAIATSNQTLLAHPNNITFWKTRARIFIALSQADPAYLKDALTAMQQAAILAPTDAKVLETLGSLYAQVGQNEKAVEVLTQTIKDKPDYYDAYYALGVTYHNLAVDKSGKVVNPAMQQKAIETMEYILAHFSPNDDRVKTLLKSWGAL